MGTRTACTQARKHMDTRVHACFRLGCLSGSGAQGLIRDGGEEAGLWAWVSEDLPPPALDPEVVKARRV